MGLSIAAGSKASAVSCTAAFASSSLRVRGVESASFQVLKLQAEALVFTARPP